VARDICTPCAKIQKGSASRQLSHRKSSNTIHAHTFFGFLNVSDPRRVLMFDLSSLCCDLYSRGGPHSRFPALHKPNSLLKSSIFDLGSLSPVILKLL
jgi:hypothetical protein